MRGPDLIMQLLECCDGQLQGPDQECRGGGGGGGDPSRQNGVGGLQGDKEASSERGERHGSTSGPAQYEAGS